MNGLFNTSTIETFKKFRSILLRSAIWIFIAGVIIGALLILVGDISQIAVIGQLLGTLFVLALAMIVSSNNFRRLESSDKTVQVFALVGLIFNLLWALLWILLIWDVFEYFTRTYSVSIFGKIAAIASSISALGFFGSNIMFIKEGTKRNIIHPLKMTAVICLIYECFYSVFIITEQFKFNEVTVRLGGLAAFAGFVWVVSTIIALIFSRQDSKATNNANKSATPAASTTPSDDQLRAEIEEKVRREMIEKEVRAKMEQEAASKTKSSSEK